MVDDDFVGYRKGIGFDQRTHTRSECPEVNRDMRGGCDQAAIRIQNRARIVQPVAHIYTERRPLEGIAHRIRNRCKPATPECSLYGGIRGGFRGLFRTPMQHNRTRFRIGNLPPGGYEEGTVGQRETDRPLGFIGARLQTVTIHDVNPAHLAHRRHQRVTNKRPVRWRR